MHFLKLSLVFTKCSVLHTNIPAGEDHRVCLSQHRTIVDRHCEFKFFIPASDNFRAESYTATLDTHGVPTVGYCYCSVFDRDILFILSYIQSLAASKGNKSETCSIYHLQTDRQSEIVNIDIARVVRACKAEGHKW